MLWFGGGSGAARPGPASSPSRSSPPAAALPGGFSVPAPLPRPSPPRWARCPGRRSRTERRRGGLRRCRPALPLRSPLETHRRGARPGVPERAGFSEETAALPARRLSGFLVFTQAATPVLAGSWGLLLLSRTVSASANFNNIICDSGKNT